MNVGPDGDGCFPPEFTERMTEIGKWLEVHGEAVYGEGSGDLSEFVTFGRQTVRGNMIYLIIKFWDGSGSLRLPDLTSGVKSVTLLTTGQKLDFKKDGETLNIYGLPKLSPCALFPVIRVECDGAPSTNEWGSQRLWNGNPKRLAEWSKPHGNSVYVKHNLS